jgi:hypothetical protein
VAAFIGSAGQVQEFGEVGGNHFLQALLQREGAFEARSINAVGVHDGAGAEFFDADAADRGIFGP